MALPPTKHWAGFTLETRSTASLVTQIMESLATEVARDVDTFFAKLYPPSKRELRRRRRALAALPAELEVRWRLGDAAPVDITVYASTAGARRVLVGEHLVPAARRVGPQAPQHPPMHWHRVLLPPGVRADSLSKALRCVGIYGPTYRTLARKVK